MKYPITRRRFLRQSSWSLTGLMLAPQLSFSNEKPAKQIFRTIPATGEQIPAIGMGSWITFDVGEAEEERAPMRRVLKHFIDLGGVLIDSSPMYGWSERVIGELAEELHVTDELWVATKVWTRGKAAGQQQIENSTRLFRKSPTLLQVHNLVDFQTHIKTLRQLKAEGTIRYLGVTHYLDRSHDDLADLLKKEPLDFLQINLSVRSRAAEDYLLPLAAEKGVAVIINQPFETARLFRLVGDAPLPSWASEVGITTWAAFFLKYIISNPHVTCAIPATSQVPHVKENMAACYGDLPDQKMRQEMVKYFESL